MAFPSDVGRRMAIVIAVFATLLPTAGCAGWGTAIGDALGRPVQPSIPDPTAVSNYQKSLSSITNYPSYVEAGYALVDQNCEDFFQALYAAKSNEQFVRSQTMLTLGTASAAIAIATKAAKTLAYIATGTAFVSQTFENFETWSYLTLYQAGLKDHVKSAQAQLLTSQQPGTAADAVTADMYVKRYAYLCTPMEMDLYINNALNTTQPKVQVGALAGLISQISSAFAISTPLTADNLAQLNTLLNGTADGRKAAAAPFNHANPYWDANGNVQPPGSSLQASLKNILTSFGDFATAMSRQGTLQVSAQAKQ